MKRERVVLDLVSSEDGEEPSKPKLRAKRKPRRLKKRRKKWIDPLDPENWRSGLLDSISTVDPAPRNFGVYKFSVKALEAVGWDWVDFQGVLRSKKSAPQVVQQLEYYVDDNPALFDEVDLIVVETQIYKSAKNTKVQQYLMNRFPRKCIEAHPKIVAKALKQWISLPTACYSAKKQTATAFGKHIMTPRELEMFETIQLGRKALRKAVNEHEGRLIKQGRIGIKKPRTVKYLPADIFETMLMALCVACELLGRDLVAERLKKTEERRRKETLEDFLEISRKGKKSSTTIS